MAFGNYNFFISGLWMITIVLFGLGFLSRRRKIISYFFWTLTIASLTVTISSIYKPRQMIKKEEEGLVGTFRLSIKGSILKGYDSSKFQSVTLTAFPDNTFKIEPDVPFMKYTKGTWKRVNDGEVSYIEINNDNGIQGMSTGDGWMFIYPQPKSGQRQIEQVVFEK